MTTNAGSAAGGGPTPPSPAELNRTADAIAARIAELRHIQAAVRWQMTITTLLILALMLIFALTTYNKVRHNLSAERMQDALSTKASIILPELQPRFMAALQQVEPTYRDLAMERLKMVAPQVQERFRNRVESLPRELQDELRQDLMSSVQRVESKLQDELKQQYPKLTDEQLRSLGEQLHTGLAAEGQKLAQRMQGLLQQELTKLEDVLDDFPLPNVTEAQPDELQKLFVHSLIMMADHELLVRGTDEEITNRVIGVMPELGHDTPTGVESSGQAGPDPGRLRMLEHTGGSDAIEDPLSVDPAAPGAKEFFQALREGARPGESSEDYGKRLRALKPKAATRAADVIEDRRKLLHEATTRPGAGAATRRSSGPATRPAR
jgi:hypothetical protein